MRKLSKLPVVQFIIVHFAIIWLTYAVLWHYYVDAPYSYFYKFHQDQHLNQLVEEYEQRQSQAENFFNQRQAIELPTYNEDRETSKFDSFVPGLIVEP